MLRSTLVSIIIVIAQVIPLPGLTQDLPSVEGRPSHYRVRFGATIGELEPVAGEVLCARDRDCEILLAFVPKVTIRLRADPNKVQHGLAKIDCADLRCVLSMQEQEVSYNAEVNDLRISTGQKDDGVLVYPVWRPQRELGRFTFVVAP
ncbi:hypothetical protein [Aureimonas pseudogalii]|uniref:Uncharacterized protein n=1 Tax=Aureimonas pseudogalii TaxID=1744844 RepID=A0A7W6H9C8_9HYPH|nr:hypothetical protein [Aureimonas pseudogalii]MBB4000841.1 hypothetical protein [Aureimonas pseudogalii]